jgi:hypothetical protein
VILNSHAKNIIRRGIISDNNFKLPYDIVIFKNWKENWELIVFTMTRNLLKSKKSFLPFLIVRREVNINYQKKISVWWNPNIKKDMNIWKCWLEYSSYDILIFPLSFFNFISYSRVKRSNLTLIRAIKYLIKDMEFWLFNESVREISYDDKRNQNFNNNCCIKIDFKDLYIKFLNFSKYLNFVI